MCWFFEKGQNGHHYNGAGIESVNLTSIARALSSRFDIPDQPEYLTLEQAACLSGVI